MNLFNLFRSIALVFSISWIPIPALASITPQLMITSCDTLAPTAIIENGLVIDIRGSEDVEIKAEWFDVGSYDNWTAAENLRFSFSEMPMDTLLAIECNILGQQSLEIWVTDWAGNQSRVETFVIVEDNFNFCFSDTIATCDRPIPVVANGLITSLATTGEIEISANDFELFSHVSCDMASFPNFDFSFSTNPEDTSATFSCDDIGQKNVEIWIMDMIDTQSLVSNFVLVQDNIGFCEPDPPSICFPTALTKHGLIANLAPDSSLTLHAALFDAGSFSECTAQESLQFSFSADPTDQTRTFTNNDVGQQFLEIWVTDGAGRQNWVENFVVIQLTSWMPATPDSLKIALEILLPATCAGMSNGAISISVSGGTPTAAGNYEICWPNIGSGLCTNNNLSSVSGLKSDTYCVIVTDAVGCEIEECFTIPVKKTLAFVDSLILSPACFNEANGSIEVSAQTTFGLAQPPYEFTWLGSPPPSSLDSDSTSRIDNLPAGIYEVTMKDSIGCGITQAFELFEPDSLILLINSTEPANCNSSNEPIGKITLSTSGGTTPYNYNWLDLPNEMDAEATGLEIGNYFVTVIDSKGCTDTVSTSIGGQIPPEIVLLENDSLRCSNQTNGILSVEIEEGTAAIFNIFWSNGFTGQSVANLNPGKYYVTVSAADGCVAIDSAEVTVPPPFNFEMTTPEPPRCAGEPTFFQVLTLSGGNGAPYSLFINDQPSNFPNKPNIEIFAGEHLINIEDQLGCRKNIPLVIEDQGETLITLEIPDFEVCDAIPLSLHIETANEITQVEWVNLGATDAISCTDCLDPILLPTTPFYELQVFVEDEYGCTAEAEFTFDRLQFPDAFTPNGDGSNEFFEIKLCENLQTFENELIVFNEWGDMVYQRRNYANDWNGTWRGKNLPEGAYYFLFSVHVAERIFERKGRIAIIR